MNGRVFDSQIGRFLSADPYVQAPLLSQSLNRYSYAMNNPLSHTDPSGFFFDSLFDVFDFFGLGNWIRYWTPDSNERPNCFRVNCNPPATVDPENGMPWHPQAHPDPPGTTPRPITQIGTLTQIGGIPPPPPRQPQTTESRAITWDGGGLISAAAQPSGELRGDAAARGIRYKGRPTPETRRATVETAAEWLRSQGIITYNPQYEDRYKHVYQSPMGDRIGDCGSDPYCGDLKTVTGGVTQGSNVTVFRGGVEPWLWDEVTISGPEIVDPSRQKWGETYRPDIQTPLESAIFVLGHEDWHVRNPPTGPYDPSKDQTKEWEANNAGRRALERWRNRKKP